MGKSHSRNSSSSHGPCKGEGPCMGSQGPAYVVFQTVFSQSFKPLKPGACRPSSPGEGWWALMLLHEDLAMLLVVLSLLAVNKGGILEN